MKMIPRSILAAAALLAACSLQAAAVTALVTNVFDDFNRVESDTLGKTTLGDQTWIENEGSENEGVESARLRIVNDTASPGSGSFGQGALVDVDLTDLEMSVEISFPSLGNYATGVMYRVAPLRSQFFNGPSSTGYRVTFNQASFSGAPPRTSNSILLEYGAYGDQVLAAYTSPTPFRANTTYSLKVRAEGDTHTVSLDGVAVITYTDPNPAHLVGGAVGFGAYKPGGYRLDNFTVTTLPTPVKPR